MAEEKYFDNIQFDRISSSEIDIVLNSESYSSDIHDILRPIKNTEVPITGVQYLNLDEIDKFITLDPLRNDVFELLEPNMEEITKLRASDIFVIYSHKFDIESDVFIKASEKSWSMIADEKYTNDSATIFMYCKSLIQQKVYSLIKDRMLEFINAKELEDESFDEQNATDDEKMKYLKNNSKIMYYVAYAVMSDTGIDAMQNMIISVRDYISTIEDIASLRTVISEKTQAPEDKIYIFSFSIMGNPIEDDDYEESDNDISTNTLSMFVNRITYKLNGEIKEYDSYQNIDLSSDEATKLHLAKSIIIEEENLTPEEAEYLEIINIELLGDGDYSDRDDYDDTEDDD